MDSSQLQSSLFVLCLARINEFDIIAKVKEHSPVGRFEVVDFEGEDALVKCLQHKLDEGLGL